MRFLDISGRKIGRLTVVCRVVAKNKRAMWLCKCDCGNTASVPMTSLKSGRTRSCGCARKGAPPRHGKAKDRLYMTWANMKQRCENPRFKQYQDYGGRGIAVCEEWRNDFQAFYDWAMSHGYRDDLTIERIDNDGNYEPNNCRWATMKEQANNTRKNRFITLNGETHTISQWADITGIPRNVIWDRINQGWTAEKAIKTPVTRRVCG